MRTPSTGREIVLEAVAGETYVDRDTGEELEVVARLLPLAPSASELPWSVENLRICNWCDQFAQRDLNDCPTCGRRMSPIPAVAGRTAADEPDRAAAASSDPAAAVADPPTAPPAAG